MSGTDPAVYLVPILAPGVLASVWPAFDRILTIACCWFVAALVVGVAGYVAWLVWGPLPNRHRDVAEEPERVRG